MDQLPEKQTLPRLIREALARQRSEVLVERVAGAWTPISSADLLARVENVAAALRGAGVAQGDRVALVARDCVDWIVCAFGTLFAGCVLVPIYPTQALDQIGYILEHSDSKLVFVDTLDALQRLRAAIPALPRAIVFRRDATLDSLEPFELGGAALPRVSTTVTPDDLAVLIYTSGTTGEPKGVMLTHDNISFDASASREWAFKHIGEGSDVLSVLPYSHIYEHTIAYVYLLARVRYFICHDPEELLADLRDARPVSVTAVPRIFDRVIGGVTAAALAHGGAQAALVPWALETGRAYMHARTFGPRLGPMLALRYAVARALVLRRIPKRLGLDRIDFITSGSAPLHIDTAMTFLGMGVRIMQGYGLTETSPVATVNRPSDNRYGSVGKPIPGVEVRIADDGEVLVRGRCVMKGYYRDEAATASALDTEGWLHTGDVGRIADGYLFITDRKTEIFKTAGGKWIAPARVEAAIRRSIHVTQAMVVGAGRPHPIALIEPDWKAVRTALVLDPSDPPADLAARDDVKRLLAAEVARTTADLATFERIRKVIVVPDEFTVESGHLSPAMKIKRRIVEQRYATEIEHAYEAAAYAGV